MKALMEFLWQALVVLVVAAVICGLVWFGYWGWTINHPGAPWWGFFLPGGK
jgi:hypothetical protein